MMKLEFKEHSIEPSNNLLAAYLLVLLIILFPAHALAGKPSTDNTQTPIHNLNFRTLNIEDGLPDNGIRQMLQDDLGFVWLATEHGLTRYDGNELKTYNHNLNEDDSISDNNVTTIFQDHSGNIWVGTVIGLNKINDSGTGFKHYFYNKNDNSSLSDNSIMSISEDTANRLWIGTDNGINLLSSTNSNQFKRYLYTDSSSEQKIVINFIQPVDSDILVGTNKGLYVYDAKNDLFIPFKINISGIDSDSSYLSSLYDSSGRLWISVDKKGIYYRDASTDNFVQFSANITTINLDFESFRISTFGEDSNGDIWIASQDNGLFIYNAELSSVASVHRNTRSSRADFRFASIQSFMLDDSGLMWLGSMMSGVFQWSSTSFQLYHIDDFDLNETDGVFGAFIWHFEEDNNGLIWISTGEGVKTYDPQSGEVKSISIKQQQETKEPEIFDISFEEDNVWFASSSLLIRYTPGKGVTKRLDTSLESDYRLPENSNIYAIKYLDGILYAAIMDHGLVAIDLKNKSAKVISLVGKNDSSKSSLTPTAIKASSDGSLWILALDGLYNYSPKEDRIRIALTENKKNLRLAHVSAFAEQSPNSFWFGTSGNGISHLEIIDYEQGIYQLENLNDVDELRNQIINGILIAKHEPQILWISTHSGLYRYHIDDKEVTQFNAKDGMQGREFNEGAYFEDSRGNFYFGGTNGFNRLEPNKYKVSNYQPAVRITSIVMKCSSSHQPCKVDISAHKLNQTCLNKNQVCTTQNSELIELPINLEKIEISVASLDYTNPDTNSYRYRFYQNENTPWINLKHKNTLVLSHLESNHYQLEIQGSNYSGNWSSKVFYFNFSIDSPWYTKGLSYFTFLIILGFIVYTYISRKIIHKQEQENILLAIKKSEENFKLALWGSGDELWEWNIELDTVTRTNPIKEIDFSDAIVDDQLKNISLLIHTEDRSAVLKSMISHLKGDVPHFEASFRVTRRGGGYLWALARARVVERNESGRSLRVLGSIKDITLIKGTEDKLNLIAKAFENTMDGISILDPSFKSVLNNKAFYTITGLTLSEAINKQYFFSEHSHNHNLYQQILISLRNFGEWEGEIWERRSNGEKFALDLKIDSVLENNGQVNHYICIFSDITYRKKAEEELRNLANIDSLTGLPNRSLFMDRMNQALAFAKRNESQFALLFIDLDHFKNVNDSLGHSIGDELLSKVAKRLSRCVRDVDTVARLGGDEFTIILENIRSADEVAVCADKIINRMMKSINISGTILKTTPSIGIGIYPADGADVETLLKNADLAMYSAKEKGRNNYQFFTADMTSSAIERISIENKLRDAIDDNQLELYYQPKVFADTGILTGFEALIRWIHPEEGIISPAAFIPVAEETGLILPMGDWILEQAISQAKEWSLINPECSSIAINLSARQFQQGKLPKSIAKLLHKYDLEPKFIELEITEGTLMSNMEHAIKTLNTLSSMGISLSLDDFGTGYSSLSYLKRFPVDKLKVDQSFVRDITTDPGDASIVASIISLAHNLDLSVIAEGCETIEQLSFINSYDCEEVQGYLFSHPLPKAQAEEILRAGKIEIAT